MDVKDFLEHKYSQYSQSFFIESDPVSIPHRFSKKEDREIAGFLAATISWGQRKTILVNAGKLMEWMDNAPHDFILHHHPGDLAPFRKFVHRTFNGTDALYFIRTLARLYRSEGGLENLFTSADNAAMQSVIASARRRFFEGRHPGRSGKHFADPEEGSAAKRINMFLRWMVRYDDGGVDFGIWKKIKPHELVCPLDIHSGRVARKLGLLKRKANDWKAAAELTQQLRLLDAADPVKYDYALFGLGVFEKF